MLKNIIILTLVYMYSGYSSAEIYKWVDEQGNIHYGDKPVVNSQEMEVDIEKKGHVKINDERQRNRQKLLNAYADDKKRENKEKEKIKEKKKKRKKDCKKYRKHLVSYERARALYDVDKKGNRVYISNAERDQATAELKNYIKKYCK